MPSPAVVTARLPQPQSQPDLAQAPRRDEPAASGQRENESAAVNDQRSEDRAEPNATDGISETGASRRRRSLPSSASPNQEDRDSSDRQEQPQRAAPRLIQWSGTVNRERVVRIEMPGVPGTVEIPRVYRERVGVVEPPSANNGWRSVVLRIFGQGNVSILIRWLPSAGRLSD
jgi:hypothetical protein